MKRMTIIILLVGFVAGFLSACGGGGYGGGSVIYRNHYGYGPWWGHRTYIDRRPIIVPPRPGIPPERPDDKDAVNLPVYPDTGGPSGPEAIPLPVEPPPEPVPEPMIEPMPEPMVEPMPDIDMGMPEMMDFGE